MDASKIDVDALFKQYTIKEIQAIDIQVKNEIEKKKEDLRVMVYNRYRDIIDAADGIHIMKNCTKKIEANLDELLVACTNISSDKENSIYLEQEKQRSIEKIKRNTKYVLAVIIKILQNSPSKIWYHLDHDEYLKAAKQYLLAQHSHVCLELEKSLKDQESSTNYIQYANELWASIVFLSTTIVNKAKATLLNASNDKASANVLIDAIAAIYLLENISLKDIFQEFLSTRTEFISSTLKVDTSSASNSTIKDRIVDCLKAFNNTVNNFYYLFSSEFEIENRDFESLITDSAFTIETLKDDGFVLTKIPVYLKNVKFKSTEKFKRFDAEYLSQNCSNWLETCLSSMKQGISNALKYATNLRSLVLIRDAVIQFESTLLTPTNESAPTWSHICNYLFKKQIDLWTELIASFYYSQSKLIIENSFQYTHENIVKNIQECLKNKTFEASLNDQKPSPETDINSYLWSLDQFSLISNEYISPNDMNSKSTNKTTFDFFANQNSKSRFQSITKPTSNKYLTTPAVQKLCRILDDDLSKLLNDIESSTSADSSNNSFKKEHVQILNDDLKYFSEYLQSNLKIFNQTLGDSLRNLIEQHRKNMEQSNVIPSLNNDAASNYEIKKILLICRFAYAVPNNCPHLKLCFNNFYQQLIQQRQANKKNPIDNAQLAKKRIISSTSLDQKVPNEDSWYSLETQLRDICKTGFNIWINHLCSQIRETYFQQDFLSLINANSSIEEAPNPLAIDHLIAWDEIEIDDELGSVNSNDLANEEQGGEENVIKKPTPQTFKSKLTVPLVCSPLIQTILYTLCQQITKNLSYNMIDSNLILKELILSIFNLILISYKAIALKSSPNENEAAVDEHSKMNPSKINLTQNQSLQMLFDIKFLFSLFDLKSSSILFSTTSSPTKENDKAVSTKLIDEYKSVTSILESLVDPFDYDICTPFIQSNINKAITRSTTLYGVLNTNDKLIRNPNAAINSNIATANDKFNLMIMSSNQSRFELLPVATTQHQTQQANSQQSQYQANSQTNRNQSTAHLSTKSSQKASRPLADSSATSSSSIFGFKWF